MVHRAAACVLSGQLLFSSGCLRPFQGLWPTIQAGNAQIPRQSLLGQKTLLKYWPKLTPKVYNEVYE